MSVVGKLNNLIQAFNDGKTVSTEDVDRIVEAVKEIKLDLSVEAPVVNVQPPKVNVTVPRAPEIPKPTVVMPSTMKLAEAKMMLKALEGIEKMLKSLKKNMKSTSLPVKASDPVSVRLSDGKKFYRALAGGMTSLNNILTFATSDNAKRAALVDSDGHVQVDIDGVSVNPDGSINVVPNGSIVDTNNTTTDSLLADEVFTGEATEILHFATIALLVYSDVASATEGMAIQFSSDGSDWHVGEAYSILAGATKFFTPPTQSMYYRIVYTNGGTDQTDFHIHAVLKKTPIKWSSHNIEDPIKDQDDSELVKAVITGKKANGDYDNVSLTNGANMKVSIEEYEAEADAPFYLKVSRGLKNGYSFISKFGQNSDIGTGAYEDIWDGGGTYTYPADSTADITELVSTSGSDTEVIEIQGLAADGTLTVFEETLTGTTPVTLTTPLWRVFRLKNKGSNDLVGSVTVENTANTVEYAKIDNGNNQTLMALYTIPAGKTGYLIKGTASITGTNRAYSIGGKVFMRPFGGVFQLKNTFGVSSDGSSYFDHEYPIPLPIAEKTDIRVQAISSASGGILNNTFDILLIDD